jgi:hypothetical protein
MKRGQKSYEMIEAALDEIREPEHWCKGALKTVRNGVVAYCALGAFDEVTDFIPNPSGPKTEDWRTERDAWMALWNAAGGNIVRFNNTHTHAEVVAMFQQAARAEKERLGVEAAEPVAA